MGVTKERYDKNSIIAYEDVKNERELLVRENNWYFFIDILDPEDCCEDGLPYIPIVSVSYWEKEGKIDDQGITKGYNLSLDRALEEIGLNEGCESLFEFKKGGITREDAIKIMINKGFIWKPELAEEYYVGIEKDIDYQNAIK